MKIDAVVLAGGDANQVEASLTGPKSLIDIAGRPMINYVMDALRQCHDLQDIVIALPQGTDKQSFSNLPGKIVSDTRGVVDAMSKAIDALGDEGYLLAVSSDAPMINSRAINGFLLQCQEDPADIYYTIVSKETTEAAFPGSKRTYFRLKEGVFTGGNVHMIDKRTFIRNKSLAEQTFSLRKSPFGLTRLLGIDFVIKFFLGKLTLAAVEEKAGLAFSAKVRAVVASYPELAIDVDKPEDLRLAQAHMMSQQRS